MELKKSLRQTKVIKIHPVGKGKSVPNIAIHTIPTLLVKTFPLKPQIWNLFSGGTGRKVISILHIMRDSEFI